MVLVGNIRASIEIPELTDGDRRRWVEKVWRGAGTECWIWVGARNGMGYGRFKAQGMGSAALAHRVGYVLFRGPLRAGSVLMHKCDNVTCVNPWHLVAGTNLENTWDMIGKGRQGEVMKVSRACPF